MTVNPHFLESARELQAAHDELDEKIKSLEGRVKKLEEQPPTATTHTSSSSTTVSTTSSTTTPLPPTGVYLVHELWRNPLPLERDRWENERGWALDVPDPIPNHITFTPQGLRLRAFDKQPWGTPLSPSKQRKRSAIRRHIIGDNQHFSREPLGVVRWYSTKIKVDPNWRHETSKHKWLCMQQHGDGYKPFLEWMLWSKNGYVLYRPVDKDHFAHLNPGVEYKDGVFRVWKRPMEQVIGREFHLLHQARWGRHEEGHNPFVRFWVNGDLVLQYSGDNLIPNVRGPYWSPIEMYHDYGPPPAGQEHPDDDEPEFDHWLLSKEVKIGDETNRLEDFIL